jgi:hypothetical protein
MRPPAGLTFVRLAAVTLAAIALPAIALTGCTGRPGEGPEAAGVKATYSKTTGKLELITYDTNKDGQADAWSHMDGTRLVSMDIDRDFDGVIDRWEYYGAEGALEKVGYSRAHDGRADAWAYQGAGGEVARIEISTRRDGTVSRTEFYEAGNLARAEEDSDGNGRPDKWETFRAGALATVEFDTNQDGRPDRRLTYGPDGVKAERLR